jgi:DNA-binding SARP family transcriptional activator
MLGRFEVLSADSRPVAFRSRKVGQLLAFLCLNSGRPVSNSTLQDLLWPDSDGDRQSQSLRRAIADLRDAFEGDAGRTELVRTDQGKTQIAEGMVQSDVDAFDRLLTGNPQEEGFDMRAAEAITLYGGPLLAPFDDDWIFAYRRQYEETYCRAVSDLCNLLSARGQGKEAARIAHSAIVLAPLREEPFIASIRAYAYSGNQVMAIRQFEALEKMLDDHFGQTPSEEAHSALEVPGATIYGQPRTFPIEAGGAVESESRFYVEREADALVDQSLARQEAVVLVFGPRQTGKTSLLARSTSLLRKGGGAVAITDFQSLGKAEVERPATLYRALIHSFATQLGLSYEPSWNEWVGPNSNLDGQIDALLRQTSGPVCWAMDEVDRLFGTDYADDFFGLVRSWHNRRALDPEGPWKRLSLLISYATEAHLFIKDLNQSPFNVGVRVNLRDFDEAEVADLGTRYGDFVARHSNEVYEITRGHPFLARRAFGFLQSGRRIEELRALAPKEEGPFGDHLKRILTAIQMEPETIAEVRRLLQEGKVANPSVAERLIAGGLLAGHAAKEPEFRIPAYKLYLSLAVP